MTPRLLILLTVTLALVCLGFTGDRKRAIELNHQGARCLELQHSDSALAYFDEAINADSTFYAAYANKCNVLWTLDRDTEALATVRCLTRVKSTSAEAFALEGLAYEHLGSLEKAKDAYERSLKLSASASYHDRSWHARSGIANLLTIVKGKQNGLREIDRILQQQGDSLSSLARETLLMQRNEIQAYQGGGILEFLSSSPSHQYCLKTTSTPKEIQSFFLSQGVNVQALTAEAGGYKLEIKDKFRTRALELDLADCPEQP